MLSGYDQWKLAYPPWWDETQICERCEEEGCICEEMHCLACDEIFFTNNNSCPFCNETREEK